MLIRSRSPISAPAIGPGRASGGDRAPDPPPKPTGRPRPVQGPASRNRSTASPRSIAQRRPNTYPLESRHEGLRWSLAPIGPWATSAASSAWEWSAIRFGPLTGPLVLRWQAQRAEPHKTAGDEVGAVGLEPTTVLPCKWGRGAGRVRCDDRYQGVAGSGSQE